MSDSDELAALRRLAELEARVGSVMTPEYNQAQNVGPLDAAAISAGRVGSKVLSGLKQVGLGAISRFGPDTFSAAADAELARLDTQQKENDAIFAPLRSQRPISTAIGSGLPYLAAPATSIPKMMLGAGAIGAMQYGSPAERVGRAALDAGAAGVGGALGNMAGAAFSPANKAAMSESRQIALDAAKRIGYQPRLSEITGSPFAARVEDVASRIPGGAGVMQAMGDANQAALNRAAARSIGETADELTPRVFQSASDRLGGVFQSIKNLGPVNVGGRQVLPIQINQSVANVADDILRQQGKMISGQRDESLISLANQAKALARNKGRIDGETYQLVRSGLSEASFDASGTNRVLYGRLLEALDSSAEQSLRSIGQTELANQLKTARPQYANLKVLEKGATAQAGDVSAAKVASTLRTNNPSAFREGRMAANPLNDVALIGEGLPKLRAGSQTFEREVMNPLSLAIYGPASWAAAQATTNPLLNNYLLWASRNPAMGMLGRAVNPAVRGSVTGLLGSAPSMALLPVVSEK